MLSHKVFVSFAHDQSQYFQCDLGGAVPRLVEIKYFPDKEGFDFDTRIQTDQDMEHDYLGPAFPGGPMAL